MTKRSYTLKRRAEAQEVTRRRIVEALMQLHEEQGPRNATISAIAERAGVQRLTVYRHFPDEEAMFQACTTHWLELNPPPDPRDWAEVPAGTARVRAALQALYAYYRATERMWAVSFRDEDEVPALREPLRAFRAYLATIADGLRQAWEMPPEAERDAAATFAHVLRFETWYSLQQQGLTDAESARLAAAWVATSVKPGSGFQGAGNGS